MKCSIIIYSENRTKELEFELIKKYQEDCFVTVWEQISQEDCEIYDEVDESYTYMKVFIDSSPLAVYTGSKLDCKNLNYILRMFTRQDYPAFD